MTNRKSSRHRPLTWLVRVVIAIVALVGFSLIGNGLWMKAKAALAQVLLERSFTTSITTGKPTKPWAWADITPVAKISAQRLQKSAIVLSGASGQALAFGPGHLSNTPHPGQPGTSVLAGHRDTHFTWIRHLQPGDAINVTGIDGKTHAYSVRQAWIAPYDQPGINTDSDEKLLALTTCYPFDAQVRGIQRYIVEAVFIPSLETGNKEKTRQADLRVEGSFPPVQTFPSASFNSLQAASGSLRSGT